MQNREHTFFFLKPIDQQSINDKKEVRFTTLSRVTLMSL